MTGKGYHTLVVLADFLFQLTTVRMRPSATRWAAELPFVEKWLESGGTFRSAGPRWFVVWGKDDDRMLRLRAVVLPAAWIGLSNDEMLAVLVSQLRRMDTEILETPWLSNALGRAQSRLWRELLRGD